MLDAEVLQRISKEVGASPARVESTLKLLEEGATVPFIARYRKEVTGNLDEVKIRDIDEKRQYYKELDERRQTILATIEKQGQLTDELKQKILGNMSQRASQMLSEEMEFLGAVRLSEVEGVQQQIVDVVRRLEDAGEITVATGAEEGDQFIT